MKNIKKFLALVAVLALALTSVVALIACTETHVCGHVCETCQKCTDTNCKDPACAEKCQGHTQTTHTCKHVCPTCQKCTDATCTDNACKDKCQGHEGPAPTHVCGHKCETCGKCLDATCTNAVCADKCLGHTPIGHECEHECEVCGKCATNCADPECSDKCECEGYTITIVVGDGALEEGMPTTYKTDAEGKLIGYLPEPECKAEHWIFDNWYDAEEDGNAIVEATTVFTEDASVYARYIREDGVWIGDTFKHALSINGGNADRTEYWLGGDEITLAKDDVISLYIDGKLIRHHVEPNSAGVTKPVSGTQVTEVTVAVAGPFKIYLHENETDWSCEYSGPTEVNTGSEIPEGCDAFKVTIGSNVITFYLKDSEGKAVAAEDFSKFCIYTYEPEIFGNWAGSTTKGVLSANMTGTGTAVPDGWIFRWGSGYASQTANIIKVFKNGGTYVVELPAETSGDAKITEIAMTKNTVTIDLNYEGQPEEKATLEAVGGKLSALPTEPTRDDYDFAGWFTAAVDGEQVTLDTEYTEDATIYAHWTAKIQVTVNYNYEGAAEPTIVKANKGKLTALPTAPTREGYYLVGWFTAATEGTKITVNYVFTEDTTIYAQWGVRVDATVTVNYNYEGSPETTTIAISAANGNLITPFPTAPEREGYKFLGWYTTAVDTEEVIGELVTEETEIHENITIYARYAKVYTLTIVVGEEGSLPTGAATTYEILDGKVQFPEGTTALPTVTVTKAHWTFKGWYKGTTAVDVATTVFEEDTTLTAKIVREDGVWKGETFVRALTINTGNTQRTEYWLGGAKITLAKGDKISLYIGGIIINHYVEQNSAGIVKPAASALVSEVTVDVAGEMAIYLHKNTSDWSCEYSGPTEVIVGSEVPIGCDMFTVTMGTNKINFFLKDASGKAVSKADFSNFCIYTYETEIFGSWANSASSTYTYSGILKEEMKGSGSAVPNGWIFRWGSGYGQQTSNLVGAFKAGKTYLVELKGHQQGATITELTITATYTITFDQNYEGQPETKVTGKAYNGKLTNLYTFTLAGNEDKDLFWYTAKEGGEKVTYNTVFTADTTIYARWSEKVKITPNLNYENADAMAAITVNLGQLSAMPANPTREGYEFLGWFTLAEGGERVTTSTVFEADSQIYAHWRVPFKVTFDLNYEGAAEAEVKTANVVAGETYSKLTSLGTNPTRDGYEFLGWFSAAEDGDRITISTQYTGDTTIYAHWRVPFVVTFDYNYGADATSPEATKANASVVSGQTYSRLTSAQITTPVREGYDFLGWYPNADGSGTKLTTSINITEDVTYYASWRLPIEVTFDLNYTGAAEATKKTATLVSGQIYSRFATADIPAPVREGYDFLGWYPNADGSGSKLIYTTNLTENVTYYASWRLPIVVTFNLNYTDCAAATTETATLKAGYTYSTLTTAQIVTPTRDGYDFLGWYNTDAATGGSKLSTSTQLTANVTYSARWKEIVKVTFNLNYDGAAEPTVVNAVWYNTTATTATAAYSRVTLPTDPTRDGYDFLGWYPNADGTGTKLTATTSLYNSATYYAKWKVKFVVTFDLNYEGQPDEKATLQANSYNYSATSSRLAALPTDPVRDGYTFDGWYNTANATGGTKLTTTTSITANVTYYARWTALPIVTFDLNDGEEHETNATLTVNAEKKLTAFIAEPTREGYTFDGWYTAAEDGEEVTLEKVYSADTTIYAHWTAVTIETPETEA